MRILLLGFGAVGATFVELIENEAIDVQQTYGFEPIIVGVVDSKGSAVSERGLQASVLRKNKEELGTVGEVAPDLSSLLQSKLFDVVVDATPSSLDDADLAVERMRLAFRHGVHFVTVNKSPMATAMPALLELARLNNRQLRYSGTVGAGLPVLELANRTKPGAKLRSLRAILNGTSNYILGRMDEGISLEDGIREAQQKGYAETDPAADVDGVDAALKLVILANAVLGLRAAIGDVTVQGIRDVKPRSQVRLVAEISLEGKLSVSPQVLPDGDSLLVPGTFNAVVLAYENLGPVTLSGRGAGVVETSTAMLRDLISISHHMRRGS